MRKIVFLLLAATATAFLTVSPVKAERYVVFDFDAPPTLAGQATILAETLRARIGDIEETTVPQPSERCFDAECAQEVLREADAAITGRIVEADGRTTLLLTVYWIDGDILRYPVDVSKSDEFNRLAPRLAEAVATGAAFDPKEPEKKSVAPASETPATRTVHQTRTIYYYRPCRTAWWTYPHMHTGDSCRCGREGMNPRRHHHHPHRPGHRR